MNPLSKIVASATPGTAVLFRERRYGTDGAEEFLRDVLALANAAVDGPRYIIIGLETDAAGRRRYRDVPDADFSGKPSYRALVADYIEPPVRLHYTPVSVEGARVGLFEIPHCQDQPYMMRVDHSETLRRGEAWARINEASVKLGRRQLQEMFARRFRDAVGADTIEVGFPGEIIHKTLAVPVTDLAGLPSAVASRKLRQLIDIRSASHNSGATTVMARLTHARLFGTERPYEDRSPTDLITELTELRLKHGNDDEYYLFEQHGRDLDLVVYNQGDEDLKEASLTAVLPNHAAFYVATGLPKRRVDGRYVERSPAECGDYPVVSVRDESVHVTATLGDVPAGALGKAFRVPLRVCAGEQLSGRRFGLRYRLHAANLREPVKGNLRLHFGSAGGG